jgi:hypothetical protein
MTNLFSLHDATVVRKPSVWKGFISQKAHLLVQERGMKIILLRCHAYLVFERVTTFPLFKRSLCGQTLALSDNVRHLGGRYSGSDTFCNLN